MRRPAAFLFFGDRACAKRGKSAVLKSMIFKRTAFCPRLTAKAAISGLPGDGEVFLQYSRAGVHLRRCSPARRQRAIFSI